MYGVIQPKVNSAAVMSTFHRVGSFAAGYFAIAVAKVETKEERVSFNLRHVIEVVTG